MTSPIETDISSLANNPNVVVALVAAALANNPDSDNVLSHVPDPPKLPYTNTSSRLIGLLPTPDNLRSVLDALVEVSTPTSSSDANESIACALRLDSDHPTRPTVELILSSHFGPIREGTVRHIQQIWQQMIAISALPNKHERNAPFVQLLTRFRRTVYTYTFPRLRRDFKKHMAVIDVWKGKNLGMDGQLSFDLRCGDDVRFRLLLAETLVHLERCRDVLPHLREDDKEGGLVMVHSHDFLDFVAALEHACQAAEKLLMHDISLRVLSTRAFGEKHVLKSAFRSITFLPRHIVNLLHFASNEMSSLHSHTLVLTVVSPILPTPSLPWPRTIETWTAIRDYIKATHERQFLDRGRRRSKSETIINKQPKIVAESSLEDRLHLLPSSSADLVVHGELTLITYLHALHVQATSPSGLHNNNDLDPDTLLPAPIPSAPRAPAYNYIAVTSGPCAPCALWIDAYNERHAEKGDGMRFDISLSTSSRWGWEWNGEDGKKRGWCSVPLPEIGGADGGGGDSSCEEPIPMQTLAEGRIVNAAWDVLLKWGHDRGVKSAPEPGPTSNDAVVWWALAH
ncbi:hypothetical protein BDZ97DRAFT_1811504 [Flammula alnicola]|nr:hypothetical protein BDZ97DRAFT_1811504 [Flammula alnicola]